MTEADAHFEVIDALEGFCDLARRSPTLDGSVPLRVAQGCVPLLDGNAFGLQVRLAAGWRLRRRLGRWRVAPLAEHETPSGWGLPAPATPRAARQETADRLGRARAATLAARGWGGDWARVARSGLVHVESSLRGDAVRVWTGLLVRPSPGCALRVSRAANRASHDFDVAEAWVDDPAAFAPLVVDLRPAAGRDEVTIEGELATLAVLPRGRGLATARLEDRPEVGRAHLDFYDRAYFDAKRAGEVTRKYRRLPASEGAPRGAGRAEVVEAGAASFDVGGDGPCAAVTFRNEVAFTARFDGHRVWLDWDREALDRRARAVEARWRAALPEAARDEASGALWYLTKYFTPHPPGEPHFFTKPAAFVVTPPGWSSLVEGVGGDGYDVLRGLVHTDRFHATPAVFAFRAPGTIRVPEGHPLVRVTPLPRDMAAPRYRRVPFDEAVAP